MAAKFKFKLNDRVMVIMRDENVPGYVIERSRSSGSWGGVVSDHIFYTVRPISGNRNPILVNEPWIIRDVLGELAECKGS